MKYNKWLSKNTHLLTNSLAIVVGATGSIGKEIVDYLLYLKAKVIIGARNVDKANHFKKQMLLKYPDAHIYVEELDISDLSSIDRFQLAIDKKYPKADIFINNAGVYHLDSTMTKDGYEIHFATNALGNYYLAKKIVFDLKENARMCLVSSMSANFYSLDFSDIQSSHTKSKVKIYARSKRFMMCNSLNLKRELAPHNIELTLTHPGVCATELFEKSHSKFFMHVIYPLMRVLFHSPKKAALTVVKSLFIDTKDNEWITPRGLLQVWGYPKVSKINKKICNKELCDRVNLISNNMIELHEIKK